MAIEISNSIPDSAQHLVSALVDGDARLRASFRDALAHAMEAGSSRDLLRTEELEALAGLADASTPAQRKAMEATVQHLLTRVL
jgi:hypothetical protein